METANELANLYPFRAKAKVIQMDQELGRPRLAEFTIDILNPEKDGEDYYGFSGPDNIDRIREQTCQHYARPRADIDTEITARTSGLVDNTMDSPPKDHKPLSSNP